MNIDHIEAFVYVFHLGSINRAAEALYLTQPSVTSRIQALERELNTQLFHREGRHIALSDKGIQFLPYAQSILQTYQEAKIRLHQNNMNQQELNLACSLSVSTHIIPDLLAQFRKQYPEVAIRIMTGHSHDVLGKVLNKEVDFGIARTVTHPKIENFLFHTDPIELIVYPDHPFLSRGGDITLNEVNHEPLIFFEQGSVDWLMINGLFESKKLIPNVILEVDSMEAAKKMVMKGIGISFLPELCVHEEIKNGQLFKIELAEVPPIARNIEFIYLKGMERPYFLDYFVQFIDDQSKKISLLT